MHSAAVCAPRCHQRCWCALIPRDVVSDALRVAHQAVAAAKLPRNVQLLHTVCSLPLP